MLRPAPQLVEVHGADQHRADGDLLPERLDANDHEPVLENGFVILGVQPFWQQVAVGGVLVAAVWFDQYKRRSRNRS